MGVIASGLKSMNENDFIVSKTDTKVPVFLNQEELKKLNKSIMTCEDFVKANYEFQRAKDVLIMKLLIYSGITSSELVNLRLIDIQEVASNNKKYLQLNIHNTNLSDIKPMKNLLEGEANGDTISISDLYLKQFEKLQITNPVILKDCENIFVFTHKYFPPINLF